MKILTIFLLAIFLCSVCYAQNKNLVYKDVENHFSISYPKDWKVTAASSPDIKFRATRDDGLYLTDFMVGVTYNEAVKAIASKKFVDDLMLHPEAVEARIKKGNPNLELVSNGLTDLSGRPAFYIKSEGVYTALDGKSSEMTLYQIIAIENGYSFSLAFRSPKSEFDVNLPLFNDMAAHFVIMPKTNAVSPKTVAPVRNRRRN